MSIRGKVDITGLKEWAISTLGDDSRLRMVLMVERNNLGVDEFLAKMETWMKISRLESRVFRG